MQLGDLEKMVLQYLWQHKSADVKEVYKHFEKIRGGSLNTYQSTLDRLYKKELLSLFFIHYYLILVKRYLSFKTIRVL